jgi:purine-binding chemotaxis protein CheW
MIELTQLVVFRLDAQRYALPLETVERIVQAAEITPLPNSPDIVIGAIDVAGRILPVLNIRRRFGLPEREIGPNDQFLIALMTQRTVVLVVDVVQGVLERSSTEVIDAAQIVPGLDYIQGVVRFDDGLVLIHNLEKFFSLDEALALDEALNPEVAYGT